MVATIFVRIMLARPLRTLPSRAAHNSDVGGEVNELPMRSTLRASSPLHVFLLLDPGAIEHTFRHGRRPDVDDLARETRNGNAVCYMAMPRRGGDAAIVAVFVDETPEDAMCQRFEHPASGHLYVPDGELVFLPAELVENLGDAGDEEVEPLARSANVRLPPGDYAVEAFDLNWRDPPSSGRPLLTAERVMESLRLTVFVLTLTLMTAAVMRPFARRVWVYSALIGLLCGAVLSLTIWQELRNRWPLNRLHDRLCRAEERFPHAAVILRRLPPRTRTGAMSGCTFGPGTMPAPAFEVIMPR
jgi:hypothetical protein